MTRAVMLAKVMRRRTEARRLRASAAKARFEQELLGNQ